MVAVAALGLGGCVAVPYDPGYGGGYYAPAPVVVQPAIGFGYYGGYRGGPRGHYGRHWR